jgi:hypothetical protein
MERVDTDTRGLIWRIEKQALFYDKYSGGNVKG